MEPWLATQSSAVVRSEIIMGEAMAAALERAWRDAGRDGPVGMALVVGDVVAVHEGWKQIGRFRASIKDSRLELTPL
jgi:hypothetical protein